MDNPNIIQVADQILSSLAAGLRSSPMRALQTAPVERDPETGAISVTFERYSAESLAGAGKVITVAPLDKSGDTWRVGWRDDPESFVSGTLGTITGGTPDKVGQVAAQWIAGFIFL